MIFADAPLFPHPLSLLFFGLPPLPAPERVFDGPDTIDDGVQADIETADHGTETDRYLTEVDMATQTPSKVSRERRTNTGDDRPATYDVGLSPISSVHSDDLSGNDGLDNGAGVRSGGRLGQQQRQQQQRRLERNNGSVDWIREMPDASFASLRNGGGGRRSTAGARDRLRATRALLDESIPLRMAEAVADASYEAALGAVWASSE